MCMFTRGTYTSLKNHVLRSHWFTMVNNLWVCPFWTHVSIDLCGYHHVPEEEFHTYHPEKKSPRFRIQLIWHLYPCYIHNKVGWIRSISISIPPDAYSSNTTMSAVNTPSDHHLHSIFQQNLICYLMNIYWPSYIPISIGVGAIPLVKETTFFWITCSASFSCVHCTSEYFNGRCAACEATQGQPWINGNFRILK